MPYAHPRSTARLGSHPIHPMLVPFAIAGLVGALVTDIAYWKTANIMWADFSSWLITVAVIFGVLAGIAGLVDFIGDRGIRAQSPAWPHAIGNLIVLALAIVNMLVHTHDGWTSVMPWGLTLSAISVLVLLVTGWLGWSLVYRHRVGIADETY